VKVLGLDISTKPGWALLENAQLLAFGQLGLDRTVHEYGPYPWNYVVVSDDIAGFLYDKVVQLNPDIVVIEETNLGKNRYAQKTLEFIHRALLVKLQKWAQEGNRKVIYLSSSSWRQALGLVMSKEDKKNNAKIAKAKKLSQASGHSVHALKKTLGVRGKINKKHLALRYVNETFGLTLKVKDNDAADAICLAAAFLKGATPADGVM
jgi:hypothetical protein